MSLFEKVYAQRLFPDIQAIKPDQFLSINDVLRLVVNGLLILAGGLAVIYIIWSGYQYIASAGNPDAMQKARNGLFYAIIGIAVVMLSFALLQAIPNFLGAQPEQDPCLIAPPGQPC